MTPNLVHGPHYIFVAERPQMLLCISTRAQGLLDSYLENKIQKLMLILGFWGGPYICTFVIALFKILNPK